MEDKTARTWDSFKETLNLVIPAFKVSTILEWGPGASSKNMLTHKCVSHIDSFEHDEKYYEKAKKEINDSRFNLFFEDNEDDYVNALLGPYNLVFIDGKVRERCIVKSHQRVLMEGLVMVHDAERGRYKEPMLTFDYIVFTDCGSTATLTNSFKTYRKLLKLLTGY